MISRMTHPIYFNPNFGLKDRLLAAILTSGKVHLSISSLHSHPVIYIQIVLIQLYFDLVGGEMILII
jgi:hypothetical protein